MTIVKKKRFNKKIVIVVFVVAIIFIPVFIFFRPSNTTSQSSTMVNYIEKVNEQVFLNVGIQDVESQVNNITIPWTKIGIPLTEKKAIIILNYDAKLGIKKPVKIISTGEKSYRITIPKYEVIGISLDDESPYSLYDSRGELLSYSTEDVDTGEIATENLTDAKQQKYLTKYKTEMNESAKEYYETLFKSVDSSIELSFVYPD